MDTFQHTKMEIGIQQLITATRLLKSVMILPGTVAWILERWLRKHSSMSKRVLSALQAIGFFAHSSITLVLYKKKFPGLNRFILIGVFSVELMAEISKKKLS